MEKEGEKEEIWGMAPWLLGDRRPFLQAAANDQIYI